MQTYWREATDTDVCLYASCLSSVTWRSAYGSFGIGSLPRLTRSLGVNSYDSVKRFVVVAGRQPISFFHFQALEPFHNRQCILSGGVDPKFINTGLGLKTCCLALNVGFGELAYRKIVCEVLANNVICSRMLIRAGFSLERIAKGHTYSPWSKTSIDMEFYGLLSSHFPNAFVRTLLGKLTDVQGQGSRSYIEGR